MKRGFLQIGPGLMLATLLVANSARSEDLLQIYDMAVINDPQIREADATRLANREAKPQAVASLLPQVSGSANMGRNNSDANTTSSFYLNGVIVPSISDVANSTDSNGWGFDLRQSVFSWQNWVALRTASHEVAQAEADYIVAQQSLAQRVSSQYFAVLSAIDNIEALEAARVAISRQLDQAERRFEVGLIAITDVQDSRAARDQAAAAVIEAKRALSTQIELLRVIIGDKPERLTKPGDNMPLQAPAPADEEQWVKMSMDQNSALLSSRLAADIARDQVSSAFGGHLPSVDLVAGRTYSDRTGDATYRTPAGNQLTFNDATSYGNSISLQLSMPIFSGGATSSRVRQSQYRWIAAKERLERTSRATEGNARDAYQGVNSDIARVQALKQAVESSQTALKAAEAGYEVGTRTTVDVLTARRQLIQAQQSYSSAKYGYLNNLIRLQLTAGALDRGTIESINRWLTVDVPLAGTTTIPVVTPPAPAPAVAPPPANN
jgi:outer membrane protein